MRLSLKKKTKGKARVLARANKAIKSRVKYHDMSIALYVVDDLRHAGIRSIGAGDGRIRQERQERIFNSWYYEGPACILLLL